MRSKTIRSAPLALLLAAGASWCAGQEEPAPPAGPDAERAREAAEEALAVYERASLAMHEQEYRRALEGFEALLADAPTGALADEARFWRGRCFELLGERDAARTAYDEILERAPASSWAGDARERLAALTWSAPYDRGVYRVVPVEGEPFDAHLKALTPEGLTLGGDATAGLRVVPWTELESATRADDRALTETVVLGNGDKVTGVVVGLTPGAVRVDVPALGTLELPRVHVVRVGPAHAAGALAAPGAERHVLAFDALRHDDAARRAAIRALAGAGDETVEIEGDRVVIERIDEGGRHVVVEVDDGDDDEERRVRRRVVVRRGEDGEERVLVLEGDGADGGVWVEGDGDAEEEREVWVLRGGEGGERRRVVVRRRGGEDGEGGERRRVVVRRGDDGEDGEEHVFVLRGDGEDGERRVLVLRRHEDEDEDEDGRGERRVERELELELDGLEELRELPRILRERLGEELPAEVLEELDLELGDLEDLDLELDLEELEELDLEELEGLPERLRGELEGALGRGGDRRRRVERRARRSFQRARGQAERLRERADRMRERVEHVDRFGPGGAHDFTWVGGPGARRGRTDRVFLENGDTISGDLVRVDGETVHMKTDYGEVRIDREQVARIVFRRRSGDDERRGGFLFRPDRPEPPARPDRPSRPDRPARPDRPGRPDRPRRPDARPDPRPDPRPQSDPARPFLGIAGGDSDGGGARIDRVIEGTVAESAGLEAGDVIVRFDGEEVRDLAHLAELIRAAEVGDRVRLVVRRGDDRLRLRVELRPRPSVARPQSFTPPTPPTPPEAPEPEGEEELHHF